MLNTLQQHLRNVRSVISRSYNVHQCHPKVLMFFFGGGRGGGGQMSSEKQIHPTTIFSLK